ncbi:cytochrome c biogenesis protein CcsA [Bermanella marisrubri]|uniref:Cytochrome c assembly protein n=1 Tax=Bermanella marisrubri TaxID=207949 RepID=Q1N005_9GAMM|nr:cytochrome c biogenesis protein CcsA [Bermanella marisrubri]EAT11558.1 Cytochrome c assembly protein [Oceanobacter sp. RED65] [Bermanella marisrubri]QIZ84979.1 cytochrome c biogenesis protein CcsA [Bermanella marisrubri]
MATSFAVIAIVLYSASAIRQYITIGNPQKVNRQLVLGLGTSAVASHVLHWVFVVSEGQFSFGFFMVGSLIALVVSFLFVLSALKKPLEPLLLGVFPMSAVILIINILAPNQPESLEHSIGSGILSHIILSIVAYSVLIIAAFQAILLMVQDHHLKHKQLDGIMRVLPPLQTMERLLFEMLTVGTVLLSLSILSGFVFIEDFFAQHLVHKTAFTILAWATFSFLLFAHWKFGWRGNQASRWTLAGTSFLILAYFGSKFVLEILLGRP